MLRIIDPTIILPGIPLEQIDAALPHGSEEFFANSDKNLMLIFV